MKALLTVVLALVFASSAVAFDLGSRGPDKPVIQHDPGAPDADVLRQGGDTILDAVLVDLPVHDLTGTTAGYNDDYDEVCPYSNSTSPDVVYTFVAEASVGLIIDMYGSAYDTKIYLYDENLAMIACNDDFYADYTSLLENVPVVAGVQYFLVIDGYGGDFGDYLLQIDEFMPCQLGCPVGAVLENEPPLQNDYVDLWNGGCNTDPDFPPFQPGWWGSFCGVSGFYLANGGNSRDTDWMLLEMPSFGYLEILGDAELATYMFELQPQDCGSVAVVQNVQIGPCLPGWITVTGTPGSHVWFWVGPTTFASPDGSDVYEYDYVLINNSIWDPVESSNWTDVRALFD